MKISELQRFVAIVDQGLHVPRAADELGVALASLYSTIDRLEDEVGHPLFTRSKPNWSLTPAGALLLEEARTRIAEAPAPARTPKAPAGGKAKASKGKGRAPIVKGQPKPYKKRQGR
ncbi:LysR family transcriptional regulator [Microbacterium sp. LWH7-1.2]|uniref:LysR family transcriptional regulator n=1 Tax=Microbacterium sp. LWH7-1.2 TaxID=3135257 RepID=UPI0031387724